MSLSEISDLFKLLVLFLVPGIIFIFQILAIWTIYVGISTKRNISLTASVSKTPYPTNESITGKICIETKKTINTGGYTISLGKRNSLGAVNNRGFILYNETVNEPTTIVAGSTLKIPFTLESLETLKQKACEKNTSPQAAQYLNTEGEGHIYTLFVNLKGKEGSLFGFLGTLGSVHVPIVFQLSDGKII